MTAAPNYLVDDLVRSFRNKYVNPTSSNLFQDSDVVALLDEEMRSSIVPLINSVREEYWVTVVDTAITGAAGYTIPIRSSGAILRDVVFVDGSGNEIELTKLSTTQIKSTFPFGYQLPLYMFGYYLQDDQVFLFPQNARTATGYTLRMKFFRRPNNLTLAQYCGKITNIAGSVITLDNIDPTWTTTDTFDIIQNFPQFKSIVDGAAITLISAGASQITLASVPSNLAIGMYLCPTSMSCIPQIPYEAFPILVEYAIQAMADSIGDSLRSQTAAKKIEKMAHDFINLIAPRVQGGAKKIINRNRPSMWGAGGGFIR